MIRFSDGESRVMAALRKNPESTPSDLVQKANVSRTTVRNALIKIEAQGHLITNMEWPRRYTFVDIQPTEEDAPPGYVVAPDAVKPKEIGKRWTAGRPRILKVIEGVDLSKMTKAQAEEALGSTLKAISGIYVALARIPDGPEWRKEAGV